MPVHQKQFEIEINPTPLWCSWFSGWIDGEGSFFAIISNRTLGISARIQVGVRDDDCNIVREVKETLQCGILCYTNNKDKRAQGLNYQDAIAWRCTVVRDLRCIIIPMLDRYPLRTKKKRDYEIWRELVVCLHEGFHLSGEHRGHCLDLYRKLKEIKKYKQPDSNNLYV